MVAIIDGYKNYAVHYENTTSLNAKVFKDSTRTKT